MIWVPTYFYQHDDKYLIPQLVRRKTETNGEVQKQADVRRGYPVADNRCASRSRPHGCADNEALCVASGMDSSVPVVRNPEAVHRQKQPGPNFRSKMSNPMICRSAGQRLSIAICEAGNQMNWSAEETAIPRRAGAVDAGVRCTCKNRTSRTVSRSLGSSDFSLVLLLLLPSQMVQAMASSPSETDLRLRTTGKNPRAP